MAGIMPNGGVPASQTQNALSNPSLAAGCSSLWHAARCTPRFDPFAANAVISEIVNLVNCAGRTYDCTILNNMCLAVRQMIQDGLTGCLTNTFPSAAGACTIEQLVQTTDATGCRRIAVYTAAAAQIGRWNLTTVWPTPTGPMNAPPDPTNMATYYNLNTLTADVNANTVNQALLNHSRLSTATFELDCAATIEFDLTLDVVFDPATNGGNGAASTFAIRRDGVWEIGADNLVLHVGSYTNFENTLFHTFRLPFTAGAHTLDMFIIGENGGQPAAQGNITVAPGATATTGSSSAIVGRIAQS